MWTQSLKGFSLGSERQGFHIDMHRHWKQELSIAPERTQCLVIVPVRRAHIGHHDGLGVSSQGVLIIQLRKRGDELAALGSYLLM